MLPQPGDKSQKLSEDEVLKRLLAMPPMPRATKKAAPKKAKSGKKSPLIENRPAK
jgi:hypothetical protein